MTPYDAAALAGYVASPNTIDGRNRWYAGSPGLPEPPSPLELDIRPADDRPFALTCSVYGEPTKRFDVMKFKSFDEFLAYCERNGRVSEPGLPAFYHGVD